MDDISYLDVTGDRVHRLRVTDNDRLSLLKHEAADLFDLSLL